MGRDAFLAADPVLGLTQTSAPVSDAVDLDLVRRYGRISGTGDNDTLIQFLRMATEIAEKNICWRQFITATWTINLDRFPHEIIIPYPPLQSITTIKYFDTDGDQQTVTASDYQVDILREPGRVMPAWNVSWPPTRRIYNSVEVKFLAGYGAQSAMPEPLKMAIAALTAYYYEFRGDDMAMPSARPIPPHIMQMFEPYRVIWAA